MEWGHAALLEGETLCQTPAQNGIRLSSLIRDQSHSHARFRLDRTNT